MRFVQNSDREIGDWALDEKEICVKATVEELQEVADVEILRLRPNDTLILRYPGRLSLENAEYIKAMIEREFPGHKVSVLSEGASFEVLRAEDA